MNTNIPTVQNINWKTMFDNNDFLHTLALLFTQDCKIYNLQVPPCNLQVYYYLLDQFFIEGMDDFRGWLLKSWLLSAESKVAEAQESLKIACFLCQDLLRKQLC